MLASDLHVHLDGSIREGTLIELACSQGAWPAGGGAREYAARLRFRAGMGLRDCLSKFGATTALLQSDRALRRVAAELVEDSYLDGARHVEVRVCPLLHTRAGLSPEGALDAVLAGLEDGASAARLSSGDEIMYARAVVTVLQGMGEDEASSLVSVAARRAGVCGVDLAGDESLFDASRFAAPFARARDAGLGVTVHAGETGDAAHVRDAVLALGAQRIGHATAAAGDPGVLDLLAERDVVIEACLTSNVHTGSVPCLEEHPLQRLASRARVVLSTDNRFFSSTTLSAEYDLARDRLGIAEGVAARMAIDSARAAFLPEEDRAALESLYAASMGLGRPRDEYGPGTGRVARGRPDGPGGGSRWPD